MTGSVLIECNCTCADKCPQGRTGSEAKCRIPFDLSPVPMILTCPACGERHVDKGEFATKQHHTHACQGCGLVWRPAIGATVGVQFLPGFKDQ